MKGRDYGGRGFLWLVIWERAGLRGRRGYRYWDAMEGAELRERAGLWVTVI